MRDRRSTTIENLRQAIDCLPRDTKIAMLNGINNNPIIVGAYSDGDGGICPMLAAHRHGGRTSFIQFAKAWDRFAYLGTRAKKSRRATERELLVLRSHLESSLMEAEGPAPDLAAALSEHQALRAENKAKDAAQRLADYREEWENEPAEQSRARMRRYEERKAGRRSRREHGRVRPGDADRTRELENREGWAWMKVVRDYDEYERVLDRLEHQRDLLPEHLRGERPDNVGGSDRADRADRTERRRRDAERELVRG